MKCTVAECGKPARYRTIGEPFVALVCLEHMELALDGGCPPEQLVSLPKKAS